MAEEGKPLGQLVRDLQQEYGAASLRPHRPAPHQRSQGRRHAPRQAKPAKMGSFAVLKVETLDGVKFFLDAPTNGNGAEAWVLVRASGTEPLLRIYCEAASPELVSQILKETEAFVKAGSQLAHRFENVGLARASTGAPFLAYWNQHAEDVCSPLAAILALPKLLEDGNQLPTRNRPIRRRYAATTASSAG